MFASALHSARVKGGFFNTELKTSPRSTQSVAASPWGFFSFPAADTDTGASRGGKNSVCSVTSPSKLCVEKAVFPPFGIKSGGEIL